MNFKPDNIIGYLKQVTGIQRMQDVARAEASIIADPKTITGAIMTEWVKFSNDPNNDLSNKKGFYKQFIDDFCRELDSNLHKFRKNISGMMEVSYTASYEKFMSSNFTFDSRGYKNAVDQQREYNNLVASNSDEAGLKGLSTMSVPPSASMLHLSNYYKGHANHWEDSNKPHVTIGFTECTKTLSFIQNAVINRALDVVMDNLIAGHKKN